MTRFKNVIVLIADGVPNKTGDIINIECVKIPDKLVFINPAFERKEVIGEGKLKIKGNNVLFSGKFYQKMPIELLETSYFAIVGKVLKRESSNRKKILACEVESIGLVDNNTDSRIPTIVKKKEEEVDEA